MDSFPAHTDCGSCPGRIVCPCLQVSEETVLAALATGQVSSLKDLRRLTGAGDGCTGCHRRLRRYLELPVLQSSSAEPICSVR